MQLPVNRAFAGGRGPNPNIWGPMFVIEAVGGDRFPPKVEPGPDPSGVQSLHWPGRCARQEARSELAAWAIRREPWLVSRPGNGRMPRGLRCIDNGDW